MNDTIVMGQNGLHSCRSGDAGAVATTTSVSAAEQAIVISTLTGSRIGQVERVDKTCFGDEARVKCVLSAETVTEAMGLAVTSRAQSGERRPRHGGGESPA